MKALKLVAAAVLLGLAGYLLQRSFNPRPSDEHAGPPAGVGQVVAEQTAKAIGEQGEILVLDCPNDSVDSKALRSAFASQIKSYKNIKVSYRDLDRSEVNMMVAISFDQLATELDKHPNLAAVVSFVGIESFSDAQIASLPSPNPKFVVVGWQAREVRSGFNKGVIAAAVLGREITSLPTDSPKTSKQWFDRYNYVLTPQGKFDSAGVSVAN